MRLAFALCMAACGTVAQAQLAHEPLERQRLWSQQQQVAISTRVQEQQKVLDDRDSTQYAANRERCASAMRIADLCGKHAGTFYCDARGFQPIPEAARVKPAALNNGGRNEMERCAREAAQAGP
jgi:hypothetical protein